jgi:phosphoglycolate phosphatase
MSPALIVFDLDGTLVDTAPDLIGTLEFILQREGLPQVPYAEARKFIGGGAKTMIERALKAEGRSLSGQALDRLYEEFIAHYANRIAEASRPFPGLEAALDELAARGHRFAVCTNKLEWLSRRLLGLLDLARYFVAICGQDTFGVQKPDPEMLRRTIAQAGGRDDCALMVGDSATDIKTARAAGVPVVGVDFGYTDVPVKDLRPDRVIGSFSDLPQAVRDVIPAAPFSAARS